MKMNLRICGLILSCLLIVFMAACTPDDDDQVGTYTFVRGELEIDGEVVSISPPDMTGTLIISSDGTFSMSLDGGPGNRPSGSGTWDSSSLTTDVGNTIPYSFDGNTIEFTLSVEGINFTYVWRKV